jgi:hypothetical protein
LPDPWGCAAAASGGWTGAAADGSPARVPERHLPPVRVGVQLLEPTPVHRRRVPGRLPGGSWPMERKPPATAPSTLHPR